MLRRYLPITIMILFVLLTNGCSDQNKLNPSIHKTDSATQSAPKPITQKSPDDEFADEFENEFASSDGDNEMIDPLAPYNRIMTSVNDKAFLYLLNPVSKVYAKVVPEKGRIGVSNVFENIKFPIRFVNNLLQSKFKSARIETERFLINSVLGLGGIMDIAKEKYGLEAHKEDFGQTLGHYGIGSGWHIVLPFLGPSNLRDTLGLGVDTFTNPITYAESKAISDKIPENYPFSTTLHAVDAVNKTSLRLGQYESMKKDAIDWYLFVRNAYEEKRNHDIAQ